jgi:hypothetical protein
MTEYERNEIRSQIFKLATEGLTDKQLREEREELDRKITALLRRRRFWRKLLRTADLLSALSFVLGIAIAVIIYFMTDMRDNPVRTFQFYFPAISWMVFYIPVVLLVTRLGWKWGRQMKYYDDEASAPIEPSPKRVDQWAWTWHGLYPPRETSLQEELGAERPDAPDENAVEL